MALGTGAGNAAKHLFSAIDEVIGGGVTRR